MVTVFVVMPSTTPSKNQQDRVLLVPSLSGPVSSSFSPSSVTSSATVMRWHCGSCRNLGDVRNKTQVPTDVGIGGEDPPKKKHQFIPLSQDTVRGKNTGSFNPIADTGYATA